MGEKKSAFLYRSGSRLVHYCPGCDCLHSYRVEGQEPVWKFDGDYEQPSLTPSMKITWEYGDQRVSKTCHYFITAGNIQYCGDSTHALAGKTLPLPPIPETYNLSGY